MSDNVQTIDNKKADKASKKAEKVKSPVKVVASPIKQGSRVVEFLGETNQEIKRVTWPTRKYVTSATIIVLVIVFVMSLAVAIVDWGFTQLINALIK